MELTVVDKTGKKAGKIELDDAVFGITPNDHVMYLDVKQYLANRRQGTAKVKSRGEVRGSTKKPFKQKGTGNARQGHKRSPLFRHGGTVHGPVPRDYSFKLNRKVKQLARKSALSYKAASQAIVVVDSLVFDEIKTKAFVAMLEALQLTGKKVLVLTEVNEVNAFRSGRNIAGVSFQLASQASTYDVLHADVLVFDKPGVVALEQTFLQTEAAAV